MNVFDKLRQAEAADRGVELTAADVHLLWEVPGMTEVLNKAEADVDVWRELFGCTRWPMRS